MRGSPQFSFWISITLAKICFLLRSHKPPKNTSVLVGTVLKHSKRKKKKQIYFSWMSEMLTSFQFTQPILIISPICQGQCLLLLLHKCSLLLRMVQQSLIFLGHCLLTQTFFCVLFINVHEKKILVSVSY